MLGFENIKFTDTFYIDFAEAKAKFVSLDKFPRNVYTRNSVKLSDKELAQYELSLTVPKNSEEYYFRILSPLVIYQYEGKEYIVNGNSRFYTLLNTSLDLDVAPIPYCYIEADIDLTDEQLIRFQSDSNDTTRKHKAIDKLRQMQAFIDRSCEKGITEAEARKKACNYFGISQQSLSFAKKLCTENTPDHLVDMLDAESITTDAAIKVLQTAEAIRKNTEVIIQEIVGTLDTSKPIRIKSSHVEKYRLDQESRQSAEVKQSLNEFIETPIEGEVTYFEYEPESAESQSELVEITAKESKKLIHDSLDAIDNLRVLTSVLGQISDKLNDDAKVTLANRLRDLIVSLPLDEIEPEFLSGLAKTLGKI
jgi:hypothetical protein